MPLTSPTITTGITLSIAGISINLPRFLGTDYPRAAVQFSNMEFSSNGTPAINGAFFEAKMTWAINALCDRATQKLIAAITYESDYQRRHGANYDILLYDYTAPVVERAPRTRALAPGAVEVGIGSAHIEYFAVFKAAVTQPLKLTESGKYVSVSLSLTETIKVPA